MIPRASSPVLHHVMFRLLLLTFGVLGLTGSFTLAGLQVPAFTAYIDPDPEGAQVSEKQGITGWNDAAQQVVWFGELKAAGELTVALSVKLPPGSKSRLQLKIGDQKHEAEVTAGRADFGRYPIASPGYVRLELSSLNGTADAGQIETLHLDGEAARDAHFNLKERRNAASVHLAYPVPKETKVALFYNEVTAVADPLYTYYMACGFSRGYFGMQVNSATERRLIFSIWDAGNGGDAKDRSKVADDDQTQLIAKGEGVHASVFGNEGTGGHSHLVYPWKTGEAQKFIVAVQPEGTHTVYSGYWFHPEKKEWMLIASFRAPKDGKYLRGLYSFSENFGGSNGHLQRKALFGPQWIADETGHWSELTTATFSHDATGKADRLDRFMGVENGKFFLSQGGFMEGRTPFGEAFTRPATAPPALPVLPNP